MSVVPDDLDAGAVSNRYALVVELPLEYPDRWFPLCVCEDVDKLRCVLDTLMRTAKLDRWPVRIQKIPVREA
jgi:hypothetical protein